MIEQFAIILGALGALGVGGGIKWMYNEYTRTRHAALTAAEAKGRETARAEAYREKSTETLAQKNLELAAKTTVNEELAAQLSQLLTVDIPQYKAVIADLSATSKAQQETIARLSEKVTP